MRRLIATLLVGTAFQPVQAFAQEQGPEQATDPEAPAASVDDEEIVVTAQRRAESVQRIPIAITALSGDSLADLNVVDLSSLAERVPNLNMGQQIGGAKITIRGIGIDTLAPGAEGPVAYHVDGVFVQRTAAALASFFDVERVEVLRGPQGTLYGRNATGGAINVISRSPTSTPEGYFRLTVGNYDLIATEGAVSGPIADGVQARIAFRTADRDGFGRNIATGNEIDNLEERAIRGIVQIEPTSRLEVELAADYTTADDNAAGYHYLGQGGPTPLPLGVIFGGVTAPRFRDMATDSDPMREIDAWGVRATLSYDFDFATFRSITSWRRTEYRSSVDLDNTSFQLFSPLSIIEDGRQFTQEVQLLGETDRLTWLLGAFHFNENDDGVIASPIWNGFLLPPEVAFVSQGYFAGSFIETSAQAVFGQATYRLTDRLRVTLGGRYSTERKSVIDQQAFDILTPVSDPYVPIFNPAAGFECSEDVQSFPAVCDPSRRWSAFTPRAAIEFQATPDTMFYASASKGFRSGIYSLGAVQAPVDPEFVWAYEAGVKSRLFDNRLRANIAGFYYDYTDLQVTKAAGTNTIVENAATAEIYGIEAELLARPIPQLQFDLTGAYLNAEFTSFVSADPARPEGDGVTIDAGVPAFNLAGNRLPQAPRWSMLAGAQYDVPTSIGGLSFRGEMSYTSRIFFSAFNRPEVSVGSRTRLNAFVNFESNDGRWIVSLAGRNLTNKVAPVNAYVSTALTGFVINSNIEAPRTLTMTLGYRF